MKLLTILAGLLFLSTFNWDSPTQRQPLLDSRVELTVGTYQGLDLQSGDCMQRLAVYGRFDDSTLYAEDLMMVNIGDTDISLPLHPQDMMLSPKSGAIVVIGDRAYVSDGNKWVTVERAGQDLLLRHAPQLLPEKVRL